MRQSAIDQSSVIDWSAPRNRGLVAWFMVLPPANAASGGTGRGGFWRDLTRRYIGTMNGFEYDTDSGWRSAIGRPGGSGCIEFDGQNSAARDYIDAGALNHGIGTGDFTLMAWVRPDGWKSYNAICAFGTYQPGFYAKHTTNWGLTSPSPDTDHSSGEACPTGSWSHLAVVRRGSTLYFLRDGRRSPSTSTWSGSVSTSNFRIGWDNFVGDEYPGKLDDVRVYKRGMSDEEVNWHYHESKRGYRTLLKRAFAYPGLIDFPGIEEADLTLALTQAVTTSATADTQAAVTLAIAEAVSIAAAADVARELGLSHTLAAAFESFTTAAREISLAIAGTIAVDGGNVTEAAASLALTQEITTAGGKAIDATVELTHSEAAACSAMSSGVAGVTVSAALALAIAVDALRGAGISLGAIESISLTGNEATVVLTPCCRTSRVRVEVRTSTVGRDISIVRHENRTSKPPCDC